MVKNGTTAAVGRGSRGRGTRGTRRSVGSDSSSPAPRGRARRAQPTEDATVAPGSSSPASETPAADAGRRVSRRQRMPNKRLMPITNGRAEPAPTPTSPSPTARTSARGSRRTRSASAAGRAGRGRRRAEPEPEPPPPPATDQPTCAEVNGVSDGGDDEVSQPVSFSSLKLTRAELADGPTPASDAERRDTSEPASVGPSSEENSLTLDGVSACGGTERTSSPAAVRVGSGAESGSVASRQPQPVSGEPADGDVTGSRDSSPDSLVQFRDPSAPKHTLGDSMDLDSTLEENDDSCVSVSERQAEKGGDGAAASVSTAPPSTPPGVLEEGQEPMDCAASSNQAVETHDEEVPAADSHAQQSGAEECPSPVIGAVNGRSPRVDARGSSGPSRSPVVDAMGSRSPAADRTGSRSPAADRTGSRSPAADAPDSLSMTVDVLDSRSPAAEMLDSRSPAAEMLDSRSPAAEMLDSRSPAAEMLDSQSPAAEVLNSRSSLADASEMITTLPSPVPPPDVDDNACSLPPMASKASDSEDSRPMAPLASLPSLPSLPTGDTATPEPTEAAVDPVAVTETAPRSSSPVKETASAIDVAESVKHVPSPPPVEEASLSSPFPAEETPMPSPSVDLGSGPSPWMEVTPMPSPSVDLGSAPSPWMEVTPMPSPSVDLGSAPSPLVEVTPMPSPSVDMDPAPSPHTMEVTPMPSPPGDIGRIPSPPPEEVTPSACVDMKPKPSSRGCDEPASSAAVRSPTLESADAGCLSPPPVASSSPLPPSTDDDLPPSPLSPSKDDDQPPSPLSPSKDDDQQPSPLPPYTDVDIPLSPPSPFEDMNPPPATYVDSECSPPTAAEDAASPPRSAVATSPAPQSVDTVPSPSPPPLPTDDLKSPPPPADDPPSVENETAPSPMSDDSARSPHIAYSDEDGDLSALWPLPPSLGRPVAPPSIEGDYASVGSDVGSSTPTNDADRPPSPPGDSSDRPPSPTPLDEKLRSLDVRDSRAELSGGSPRRGRDGGSDLDQGDVEMRMVSRDDAEKAAAVCDIPLPAADSAEPSMSSPVDMEMSTPNASDDEGAGVEGVAAPAAAPPPLPPAGRNCSVESGDRASPFMGMFDEDDSPFVVRPADEASPGSSSHRRVSPDDEPAGPPRPLVSYSARRQRPPGARPGLPAAATAGKPLRTVVVSSAAAVLLPPGGFAALRGLSGSLPIVAQSQLAAATQGSVITSSRPVMVRSDALLSRAESGATPPAAAGSEQTNKAAAQHSKALQNKTNKAASRPSKASSKLNKAALQADKASGKSGKSPTARSKSGAVTSQLDCPADQTAGSPAAQSSGKASKAATTPPATKPKTKFLERLSSGSPSSPKRSPAGSKAAGASPQTERRGQLLDDGGPGLAGPLPLDIPLPPAQPTQDKKSKDSRVDAIKNKDINKLRKFKTISDSIWLKKQKLTKQQKEARHMVCDCYLSPEEMERGDMGCGEDCLNRLLMIECGSRCPLGDRCSNKRFTKKENYPTSVFKTDLKGYGLAADTDMPEDAFIYEYVGEVLDAQEFKRRTKEYDRLKYHHYYFMALKGDAIIDATEKGNSSRFINHSCDPNSETQKWTVNGELRIGFFTRRSVSAGEELTFDYQLQRYGKEAQKCFCGSPICRGWIGEKTDEDDEEEDEDEEEEVAGELVVPQDGAAAAEMPVDLPGVAEGQTGPQPSEPRPPKVTKQAKQRRDAEKRDLEIEINKLVASGLKSKQHTLELSRLMVRAESEAERLTLLDLIRTADQPCRRLFLDYHGLRLLWSWMASAPAPQGPNDEEVYRFRRKVLETLSTLPIPNKTCLTDSRVLGAVERWAAAGQPATPCTPDLDTTPNDCSAAGSDTAAAAAAAAADEPAAREVAELAARLLESWSGLQEVFRIPKKERVEIMREHEKEADRDYQTYLQQQPPRPGPTAAKKGYDWSPERRKRARDFAELEPRVKKYRPLVDSRLTLEERRQLFMQAVEREEEERRQRLQQQQMWRGHEQRCTMLGLDPHLTPIFDPSYQYYWEPSTSAWQPYTPGDPAVPLVPAPGIDPLHVAALPQQLAVYQGLAAVDLVQAEKYLEQVAKQRAAHAAPYILPGSVVSQDDAALPANRPGLLELIQSQLPGRFLGEDGYEIPLASVPVPDSSAAYRLACYNDPRLPNVSVGNIPLPERAAPGQPPPPPPPPPEPVITLPPRWRIAKDDNDRVYFYHQVTRQSQWTPPLCADWIPPPGAVTAQQTLWTAGSSADSSPADGSDSDSSSDSSSSSEDESKPGEDDDDQVASDLPEEMAKEEDIDRRRMVDQHRRRRGKRRDRLVQERVISPVTEMSRQELRRERHRQKREAKAEARREREGDPDVAPRRPRRCRPALPPPEPPEAGEGRPRRRRPALPPPEPAEAGEGRPRRRRPVLPPPEPPEPVADAEEPPAATEPGAEEPQREPEPAGAEQEEVAAELEPEPDVGRQAREERLRRFKAKEEAIRKHQAKKQETRERRKRKAAAALAAAVAASTSSSSSKKRKVEVKRVSTSVSSGSSSASTTSSRKEKPTTAAADTSSEVARKIKDKFLAQMSGVIVSALNVFRKSGCKKGRITSTEDFKFLAKKLTHHVMVKELKNVQQVEELTASDSVKHKAKYYVIKYMNRFGETYSKDSALMEEPEASEATH